MPSPRDYSVGTRAALVSLAHGVCYFPGCEEPVIKFVQGEPYVNYEIAHIRDARPGNRFDDTMKDDERRAFANLVLLCKAHHDLIDNRHPERFSVADIERWKHAREGDVGEALRKLGPITQDELEEALREAVTVIISDSTVPLGGQGGSAPGAGGGGGGVIGSGSGGPGGPGGDTYILGGTPGSAPGAGGGGAGAVGPGAAGGEGGGGGEHVKKAIDVKPGDVLRFNVGEGGEEEEAGGDTSIEVVGADGKVKEVIRATGGAAGRSGAAIRDANEGPAVEVTAAFLADTARIREGLIHVIAGGWSTYGVQEVPAPVTGSFLVLVEPVVAGPRVTELLLEIVDPNGDVKGSWTAQVELDDPDRPLRIPLILHFSVEAATVGMWRARVLSGGVELAAVPFRLLEST
jgi:hypothetical protein